MAFKYAARVGHCFAQKPVVKVIAAIVNRSDLVKDNQLNKDFETILKAETQQVRERVEQETHAYYSKLEQITLPGEDIAGTLTTAQANAHTLFGKFYPKVEKRKALATAEQAALQHEREKEKYEELIEEAKKDLKKAGDDKTLKEVAETRLKGLEALRQTAVENWVKESTTHDALKQSLESS